MYVYIEMFVKCKCFRPESFERLGLHNTIIIIYDGFVLSTYRF